MLLFVAFLVQKSNKEREKLTLSLDVAEAGRLPMLRCTDAVGAMEGLDPLA